MDHSIPCQNKHVTFLSALRCKVILRRCDYSEKERVATWYDREELERIKEESRDEVEAWAVKVKEPAIALRRHNKTVLSKPVAPMRSCLATSLSPRKPDKEKATSEPPQKSVSFNPMRTVRPCLHRNHCTKQELQAAWYSRNDLQRIKRENNQFLKLLASGVCAMLHNFDTTDSAGSGQMMLYCTRGLENKTPQSARDKLEMKRLAQEAVLQEQRAQRESSSSSLSSLQEDGSFFKYDQEAIARVYRKFSHFSQDLAFKTALSDHQSAYPPPTLSSSSASNPSTTTTQVLQQ
jgi:hypothetical protein